MAKTIIDAFDGFKPLTYFEFLKKDFPKMEKVMGNWLTRPSVNLIHAYTGYGKTHFMVKLCTCLAAGKTFCDWKVPYPMKVLYVDAEMPGDEFRKTYVQRHVNDTGLKNKRKKNFDILTHATLSKDTDMPALDDEIGQQFYESLIKKNKYQVVVFDSIGYLTADDESKSDFFKKTENWLRRIRDAYNLVIFLLHHDNRQFKMDGRAKKLRVVHVCLHLTIPPGHKKQDGLCLMVSFDKARGVHPIDATPVEVAWKKGEWSMQKGDVSMIERIRRFAGEGYTQQEIAQELSRHGNEITQSTVSRLMKKHKIKRARRQHG